ncbi:hypothetical protein TrST_g2653 [Triparma strigata]|uniref:Uncharacterized protein n=1 Tax=Triparma strigata TaxID=1606541 RepID=A0A9W7BSX4_9STRA|nr:hypothetical protein TrST_g2653 [Triparma strigata]
MLWKKKKGTSWMDNDAVRGLVPSELIGTVVRRRCIGRNLTFATIKPTQSSAAAAGTNLVEVVFVRSFELWIGKEFPGRKSVLELGMEANLQVYYGVAGEEHPVVSDWTIIYSPSEAAMGKGVEALGPENGNGWDIGTVLSSRNLEHMKAQEALGACTDPSCGGCDKDIFLPPPSQPSHPTNPHEREKGKNEDKVFAVFINENFPTLRSGAVVDVAGGKGKVSIELCMSKQDDDPDLISWIIDPGVRKTRLSNRDAKKFSKAGLQVPRWLATKFDSSGEFDAENSTLMASCSVIFGMHPDGATEAIIDSAIKYNKPCAVVPCCVFAGESNDSVRTHEQFCEYLKNKHPTFKESKLDFKGKNVVIWRPGGNE